MELLHSFFEKMTMAALFLSVATGYWIGNLTCTPGLNGVIGAADSSSPVLGCTVSYALSNVLLTFLGPVTVLTV
jgi:uncharacterized transporter YbjL